MREGRVGGVKKEKVNYRLQKLESSVKCNKVVKG